MSHQTITWQTSDLRLELADARGLALAQRLVAEAHYLHAPVDPRCSPLAYLVRLPAATDAVLGCLIFGRPEATRCYPWYGSVDDVRSGRARLSRWEIINLARVYLAPELQAGGRWHVPNAATALVAQALRRVVLDYLLAHPPVFLDEPWLLRECLSYCDTRLHRGTLYRAANFRRERVNAQGIETYARPLRPLRQAEHALVAQRAAQSPRGRHYRARRAAACFVQEALL